MTRGRWLGRVHRAAGAGLALAVLATACREPAPAADSGDRPDQVIEGFTMHESSSGERLYTLAADTAQVFDREGRVEVSRPRVTFYDQARAVRAVLVADEGTLQSRSNDLVARGNVEVRTADSTLLATDSLSWNNETRLVRTDAAVAILTPRGEVRGQGLVSDAGLERIEIQSEVTGSADYRFEPQTGDGAGSEEGAGVKGEK
ncbi:MAG: LPS export ABC transporter periplasmic protein LptC [bacterium]